ncbi:hypothetical protein I2486_09380 [Cellulophaga sp. E16_2]|uniref:Uncharacterized protein n=1 Tax=Cellulophaga algicola (strain DSM 14237 / IC166 / ACAM 630) TaxID=688270 RepID=E6XE89_CELAD|nr:MULTISPECIES: hypothetical protein [Cellulophaga]ADV49170.1 hypothetical protein Celal_1870 [Cellulophaga algicola DSM 14237]MBO0591618.1 hypothetical protein [Cellulophaga sp. E16_2]
MSNQKPLKKMTLDTSNVEKPKATTTDEVTRVYKDQNYETKKALAFKTDADKPKLA